MKSVEDQVEELIADGVDIYQIAKLIKLDTQKYLKTLHTTFAHTGGKAFLLKHTTKIDTIIKLAYRITVRTMFGEYAPMKNQLPVTIVAMGSYGREQLCVHSDIDLMFVYEDISGYQIEAFIEKMLYLLWDIGLKLGHRVHQIDELPDIASSDITIKSAILESRYIDGSRSLWTKLENKINTIRKEKPSEFIKAKIQEQQLLHKRFPLTMEPNIKEGIGGFRDANLVYWVGKVLHNTPRIKDLPSEIVSDEDYRAYRISLEFLFRVRSALHLANNKKEDRLRMDYIPQIANLLGYADTQHAHMRFAKKVTESLRIIYLYSKIWLERLTRESIPEVYDNMLLIDTSKDQYTLTEILNKLINSVDGEFEAHPRTLSALIHADRPEKITQAYYHTISDIFRCSHTYPILKTLHAAQLLKYTIPPLKKVINLPQFDGYHEYSVDIHSLQCIWHLEHLDDELLRQRYDLLDPTDKHLLKIVTLLHDAGKGRKKPHATVGASLFRIFGQKLGLPQSHIAKGSHLIQYHDVMSRTAQREDLYNEKTILRFASMFSDRTMLDMLYLLTYADMNGVGSGVYTDTSSSLLRTLYQESLAVLDHRTLLDNTARRVKKVESLQRSKAFATLPNKLRKDIISIPSNELFIHHNNKEIISITQWAIGTQTYRARIATTPILMIEISRKTPLDLGYLLTRLSRLNIVSMDIYKIFDELKYFRIAFGEGVDETERELILQIIERAFGEHKEAKYIKPHIKRGEIEIDCQHSKEYAAMRVRARDQKGLLAYIAQLFEKLHIDIASTKIHTSKRYVNDLFLIQKDGNFCHNTDNIIDQLTREDIECVE